MTSATLAPYRECTSRSPAQCRFEASPAVTIVTGNSVFPRADVYICQTCGHGVTRPPMPDVKPLYEARESQDYLARDTGWVAALKRLASRHLARRLTAGSSPAVVADYGTGNGLLAASLAAVLPPSTKVYGLDFFEKAPAAIGTADYLSFDALDALRGKVDLLTCFHVLEHDDNPHAVVARLTQFLAPGGILIIEVPNIDCIWTPWFGRNCANWYAPYHRVHFSRRSLEALFVGTGLSRLSMRAICGPTFALSFAQLLKVAPNNALFAAAAALRPLQWFAEKLSGRPSALRIILQRDPNR